LDCGGYGLVFVTAIEEAACFGKVSQILQVDSYIFHLI
jgi:hypothetical protein